MRHRILRFALSFYRNQGWAAGTYSFFYCLDFAWAFLMSLRRCRSFCAEENTLVESFFMAKLKLVRDYLSEYLFELAAIIWMSSLAV